MRPIPSISKLLIRFLPPWHASFYGSDGKETHVGDLGSNQLESSKYLRRKAIKALQKLRVRIPAEGTETIVDRNPPRNVEFLAMVLLDRETKRLVAAWDPRDSRLTRRPPLAARESIVTMPRFDAHALFSRLVVAHPEFELVVFDYRTQPQEFVASPSALSR